MDVFSNTYAFGFSVESFFYLNKELENPSVAICFIMKFG